MHILGHDGLYHISQYALRLPRAMCSHPECLQSEHMPDDIMTSYPQDNNVFITNSSYSSGYRDFRFTDSIFLIGFGLFNSSQYDFYVQARAASFPSVAGAQRRRSLTCHVSDLSLASWASRGRVCIWRVNSQPAR